MKVTIREIYSLSLVVRSGHCLDGGSLVRLLCAKHQNACPPVQRQANVKRLAVSQGYLAT